MFRHRWYRGAWARPNGEGRVDWRGEASLGLDFFGSFWGNAKKNKLHFPQRSTNHQPITNHPVIRISANHITTHHNPPLTNPKPLKYAHHIQASTLEPLQTN
ncbi:MAG: hypothetical protein AVDCRST_MAG56-8017 [uncultured Cytophagales bacterium]|uniref:Uncharacterized protein n=1 Tax=uncultured Cytophagales bacterium TaxID=158755 RepID=A0A6J4LVW3_9SPHI|nr:MAG: hypothetical protein AVDCRST_MAG56-8017 [uncultured Cytophagales bacterium]